MIISTTTSVRIPISINISITTEASRTLDIGKTLSRDDIIATYTEKATNYKKKAEDYKTQFYTLYVKMEACYESLTKESKEWFSIAMADLAAAKDGLCKLQPFQLQEVDTDAE